MSSHDGEDIGALLGLIVHDLRNPTATLGANVSFLDELELAKVDPDAPEALQDMQLAVEELRQGLDQVAWISRWLAGEPATKLTGGDASQTLRAVARESIDPVVQTEIAGDAPLRTRGGGTTLARLVQVLLANVRQHVPGGRATLRARREGGEVVVELEDSGSRIAQELVDDAFTLAGQSKLKGRSDGRYSRVVGLLAVRALADTMGARLETDGEDGAAVFRVRLDAL